jgi:hypothetical protein
MAMACLRLVTFPPFPALPDRRVPCFFCRMALATVFPADFPYLGLLDFFVGIDKPSRTHRTSDELLGDRVGLNREEDLQTRIIL